MNSSALLGEREMLEELVAIAALVTAAMRDEDGIAFHYGIQGLEFSQMRATWLLGFEDEAQRLHGFVGEHSPDGCPVCVGESAFTAVSS